MVNIEKIIDKYGTIYASPFLLGVFMGVNAIKDVALYVDGPDCNFFRADMLYKTHDLFSDLKKASIDTKLYFSGVMPNKMVRGYDDKIKRKLGFIADNPNFNLGVVTCMPVTGLLATQYDNIYCELEKDFIFVPSFTDKFRLDGYSIFLKELAKYIKIDTNKEKIGNSVSIIGYLYDRNEGDTKGNLKEIKRILSLLGVKVDSIWLDGNKLEDLKNVEKSSLLVCLKYGNLASHVLSKRLKVDTLELEVPFGLKNTINFVKSIGKKLGISNEKINKVIEEEFKNVKEKLDLIDKRIFLNKNFIYAGDPFLEESIRDIGNLLGMNLIKTYKYTGDKQAKKQDINVKTIDLLIGNSEFELWEDDYLKLEFGFPSYNTHFLVDRPYMGFNGLLFFIERLYNLFNK